MHIPSGPCNGIYSPEYIYNHSRIYEFKGHTNVVHSLAWNEDGKRLASSSSDNTIRVWSISSSSVEKRDCITLHGHKGKVNQIAWDPRNPDYLVSVSIDKLIIRWDAKTGSSLQSIATTEENINVCWSPDGSMIAAGRKDDEIVLINTKTFAVEKCISFPVSDAEINEITWDTSGNLFFVTKSNGTVAILDSKSMDAIQHITADVGRINCIKFDKSGKYFAIGSTSSVTSLWSAEEFLCIRTFTATDSEITAISFSFDSQFIAIGSMADFIDISFVETGQPAYSIKTSGPTGSLCWNPSRQLLAYACEESQNSSTSNPDRRSPSFSSGKGEDYHPSHTVKIFALDRGSAKSK